MPVTTRARRSSGRRPAHLRLGRALAAVLALLLLLTACGGDGDEEEAPDEAAETTAEEPEDEEGEEPAGEESGEEPPEDPVTIQIGQLSIGYLPYPLMEEIPETVAPNLGTWYEVEWNQLDAAALGQGMASGVIDGGGVNTLSAGQVISQGVDLAFAGSLNDDRADRPGSTWLVRSDSGITSAADVAGETVGTLGQGTYADIVADTYFSQEGGLEPGVDYEESDVPFPQMPDALLSGQIATGPFIPPYTQQTLDTGEVEELFTASDVLPGMVIVVQAFRQEFVDENPEAVEKFVEDWVTANQWMMDPANRDQVIEIYAEYSGVPFEAYDSWILSDGDLYRPENGWLDQDALQETYDFFHEVGAIDNPVDVQEHIVEELLPPEP